MGWPAHLPLVGVGVCQLFSLCSGLMENNFMYKL